MLKNITKKTVIAEKVKLLVKQWEIYSGLMFKKRLKSNECYYFLLSVTKKWEITMFFVFQSLDLIFCLDRKVVEIKESIKPFSHYFCKKECNQLIELPPGSIKKSKTKLGDLTKYLKDLDEVNN